MNSKSQRILLLGIAVSLALLVTLLVPVRSLTDGGTEATVTPTAQPLDYTQYLQETSGEPAAGESVTSLLLGLAWKLGVVVAIMYAVLWALKKFVRVRRVTNGQRLQILDTVSLGNNRSVHLLQVGQKTILVGATPQSVSTLADVSDAWDDELDIEVTPAADESVQPQSAEISKKGNITEPDIDAGTLTKARQALESVRGAWGSKK